MGTGGEGWRQEAKGNCHADPASAVRGTQGWETPMSLRRVSEFIKHIMLPGLWGPRSHSPGTQGGKGIAPVSSLCLPRPLLHLGPDARSIWLPRVLPTDVPNALEVTHSHVHPELLSLFASIPAPFCSESNFPSLPPPVPLHSPETAASLNCWLRVVPSALFRSLSA